MGRIQSQCELGTFGSLWFYWHRWELCFPTEKPFLGDFLLLLFSSGNSHWRRSEWDHIGLGGEIPAPPPTSPQGFLVPVE